MSAEHYAQLQATGRVPATSETFISPTQAFSESYSVTLVRLTLRPGTTDALVNVGVRDSSALTAQASRTCPWCRRAGPRPRHSSREGSQINIGLGRGAALDIFNKGLTDFGQVGC